MKRNLTKGQIEILQKMYDNKDWDSYYSELVYEKGTCYIGNDRVDSRILYALLRLCAISLDQYSDIGGFERYTINETGIKLLGESTK